MRKTLANLILRHRIRKERDEENGETVKYEGYNHKLEEISLGKRFRGRIEVNSDAPGIFSCFIVKCLNDFQMV